MEVDGNNGHRDIKEFGSCQETNRPQPTVAPIALPPTTEAVIHLVGPGKLVKYGQFMALRDPVAHLLKQYLAGHSLGKAMSGYLRW